jgi:hypothetical protein
MSVHSSFQNCYASRRSISLAVLIAPSSALITGSLTPSVIGDRPSHPVYGLISSVVSAKRVPACHLVSWKQIGQHKHPWAGASNLAIRVRRLDPAHIPLFPEAIGEMSTLGVWAGAGGSISACTL